jgi:copper chaperone CopZ
MPRIALVALLALGLAGCQYQAAPPADADAKAPAAPLVIDPANVELVNFSVPDMHCEFACAPKVREVLSAQPGVAEVEVDLPSKTACVKVDATKFDVDKAIAALVDVQFDATKQISAKEAAEAKAKAAAEGAAPAADADAGDASNS